MISSDERRALAEHREEGPHVSLFMPAARAGAEPYTLSSQGKCLAETFQQQYSVISQQGLTHWRPT